MLLVYSKNDRLAPITEAEKYQKLLNNKKIKNELFTVEYGHNSEIIRNYPKAVEKIVAFLGDQFTEPQKQITIDRDLSVRKVQEGVYVVKHAFPYGCNSLVVEMPDNHLLLVDTPLTPEATKTLLDWFIDKLGQRKIVVINTGFHWDNLGGNEYLVQQKMPVYGSELTAKLVKEKAKDAHSETVQRFNTPKRKRFSEALKNLNFTAPTHLYKLNEGLELKFGNEKVEIYYPGPSHAHDNVVVYFPKRKILFGGCMISGWGGIGNTADANMRAWPKSIQKLKKFDIDILVPGHGKKLSPDLIDENIRLLEKENGNSAPQGDYLGQALPGQYAQVFAPGIISVKGSKERALSLSPNGNELFFSRTTGWPYTRIMHMKRQGDEWSMPEIAVFLKDDYATQAAFSPDGQYIYFSSSRGRSNVRYYSLWRTKKKKDGWSEPEHLIDMGGMPIMEYHPTVTRDGSLYFLAWDFDRQTGDIYVARLIDGQYANPVIVGPPISTQYNEVCPTVHPDETYLLFGSNRPGGYGGTDIYIAFKNDDGTWSSPRNLGPAVNTPSADDVPNISPDGKYWFFARNGDIYWMNATAVLPGAMAQTAFTFDYFGEELPELEMKRFNPRIPGLETGEFYSLIFTPDGRECYFSWKTGDIVQVYLRQLKGGLWSNYQAVKFPDDAVSIHGFSPDGKRLYCSERKKRSVLVRTRLAKGWSQAEHLPKSINHTDGVINMAVGANEDIYFCTWRKPGKGACDLWCAKYVDGAFPIAENLSHLNTSTSECRVMLSPNDRCMVFYSWRPGGYGKADLYASFSNEDGEWSAPRNLGPRVNTKEGEVPITFSPDGKYMFFYHAGKPHWIASRAVLSDPNSLIEEQAAAATEQHLSFAWLVSNGLRSPEAVLYDSKRDVIYVSNFNVQGGRLKSGDNSPDEFISRISPDGELLELKWITGLNAPTGMSIDGDTLYVVVRRGLVAIDIERAEIISRTAIPGSFFVNDVVAVNGVAYVTDNNKNARTTIYKVAQGQVESWLTASDIYRCNGLCLDGDQLIAFNGNIMSLVSIDLATKTIRPIAVMDESPLTGGTCDGIAVVNDQTYLVTHWAGPGFLVSKSGTVVKIIDTEKLPIRRGLRINNADVDYIPHLGLYLIPTLNDHRVLAFKLLKYTVFPDPNSPICVGGTIIQGDSRIDRSSEVVTDIDGNVYHTVVIGTQTWMVEDMKTTRYRNGDPIVTADPATVDLRAESTPKYQWPYDNNINNVATYGRLYTWYAATDPRNIAPVGWHVPTKAEWDTLVDFLGGDRAAQAKLKEAGTEHWHAPNDGTNESGFTALPGGNYWRNAFWSLGKLTHWWTATESGPAWAWRWKLYHDSPQDNFRGTTHKRNGYLVRCIKDTSPLPSALGVIPEPPTGRSDPPSVPKGQWIELFNGKDLTGWKRHENLPGHGVAGKWAVEDGAIVGMQDPPGWGGFLTTLAEYRDFELKLQTKVEWPFDSGVFLRTGADGKSHQVGLDYRPGGQIGHIYLPWTQSRVHSCPEGIKHWKKDAWNDLCIRCAGEPAHITVWLNGTKITDFQHTTATTRGVPEKGGISLQIHPGGEGFDHARAMFREISIRELKTPSTDKPKQEWAVQFGTAVMDKTLGLTTDRDGNCYVVGKTDGCLGQQAFGKTDGFIQVYTKDGVLVWSKQIGTAQNDVVRDIYLDSTKHLYISGQTEGQIGEKHAGGADVFISKYTTKGKLVWTHQFGSPDTDNAGKITVDVQGNCYVTGSTKGVLGEASIGGQDVFVIKLDTNGKQQWIKRLGTSKDEYISGIVQDVHGDIYVSGSTCGDFKGACNGPADVFVARLSALGDIKQTYQFGSSGQDMSGAIAVDPEGNMYVSGTTRGDWAAKHQGQGDVFTVCLDKEGTVLWKDQFGGDKWDGSWSIKLIEDGSGDILAAGCRDYGECKAWIKRYTNKGKVVWENLAYNDPAKNTCGRVACMDSDGNCYQTGYTTDNLCGSCKGEQDCFLIKVSPPALK